ncbi:SDR family NAD(P)-dependent oxidoreductase [Cedecea sp. P7760]|jgi:NAD(P)-dependent dehydrogenase (short-subunit alcohol dehydrogenase family)|uniref:SDR family NAD(P)-dependent oxidoreductase n=1 Tax=Cedecea sp. P7760 TaxID=2726983 RepID=UPI0015A366BA|nr:SDR family oxidoreductase [Cedecea sp. P7760]NWC65606.1 SDR family oxidoreductase [Cedecea sp. P7760]
MNSTPTVIVTGASSGIGLAIAQAYLARGYNVVGNGRTLKRLETAAASLGNPQNFLPVAGDIALKATAETLFKQAIAAFGRVDILINNAGIFIPKPASEYSEQDIDAMINTNLKGFLFPSQLAASHMSKNKAGHIVNITASVAMQPNVKVPALLPVMVKGGLNQATRALALELAADNVRVNAVAPGIIETPLHSDYSGTAGFLSTLSPSGKTGSVQDVVNAVLYLTDSEFVSGTVMAVDGGSTAGVW